MKKILIGLWVAAGALTLATSFASAAADDVVKARQACMKMGHGGLMGVAVPVMKGEKPYDAAAAAAAFDNDTKLCADWANFWTEDSFKGVTVKTHAKPEILTDKAGFEKAGNDAYTALQALKATSDEASFKAAFPAVGAACGACHEKFRTAME